jgi:hypothetical protein
MLTGACMCGTVQFAVTEPFVTAGYCHWTRCQRRSGTLWTLNGSVPAAGFRVVAGADAITTWVPTGARVVLQAVWRARVQRRPGRRRWSAALQRRATTMRRLSVVNGLPEKSP